MRKYKTPTIHCIPLFKMVRWYGSLTYNYVIIYLYNSLCIIIILRLTFINVSYILFNTAYLLVAYSYTGSSKQTLPLRTLECIVKGENNA